MEINYKVGDILILKEDCEVVEAVTTTRIEPRKVIQVVQIKADSQFPIVARGLPYSGVEYAFEVEHADRIFTNIGNDTSRILYE